MIQELRAFQEAAGATFSLPTDASATGIKVATSFGNDTAAIEAVASGVALYDRSSWGRIQVLDDDRLRFLHNQTTNDFNRLQSGQGCDTVFVTSTGRTIDLATAYVTEDTVLLLVSPHRRKYLMQWMDQFIFFADRVRLQDVTDATAAFSLIGAKSGQLLEQLTGEAIARLPYASHWVLPLAEVTTRVAVGSGLVTPGYTLIVDAAHASTLWQALVAGGAVPMGTTPWEQLRIQQGRPMPDRELTDEINPLEAGLWQTISLTKGCYIGQETIARLHTYRGVKQQLWGVRLNAAAEPGATITAQSEKVGRLTSLTQTNGGFFGLAYIRTKVAEAGLKVHIGDSKGELVSVPFVTHTYL